MISKFILLLLLSHSSNFHVALGILSPEVQKLCDEYFDWRMKDMPQFATFVGIHDYNDLLDDMSEKAYYDRYESCQMFLAKANTIEPSLTEDADIVNLKVLKYELLTYIDSYHLKGFYLPMNCLEGPHLDMEKQFGWMLKNTSQDYEVMIKRMEKIPLQLDQIIDLMKAGVQSGITYHEISMKNMNSSIGRFVVKDSKESPFYAFFKDGFPTSFTKEDISHLQLGAQQVISNKVTPAFEKLKNYVMSEYATRKNISVTTMENGKEFYNNAITFHTSTNLSAVEIQNIGFTEVQRIEKEMLKIIVELGYKDKSIQEFSNMIRDDAKNYYNNSADLMKGFEHIVYNLVPPQLPKIFKNIPKAHLKIVSNPSSDAPAAYYYSGAYDGSRPGVYFVNTRDLAIQPKYLMLSLSLHEGIPGHHLQISHSIESPEFPYFRRVLEDRNYGIAPSRFPIYTSYTEGWALYAEGLGFDMNLYENPLDRYGHLSLEIYRACRLVVDTGIHALGWSREQAIDFMFNRTASAKGDIENEIDRYITWPGQALAYKIGQITFSKLRNQAEEELGPRFNIKEFHDVVLNSFGPMDVVHEQIYKWINSLKANVG